MGRLDATRVDFDFFIILPKSDDDWNKRHISVVSDVSDLYI